MYLWKCVLVQCGVLVCYVDQIERDDVALSLDLMDDRVSIGHVFSVHMRGLSG